jgi:hypothetical protein
MKLTQTEQGLLISPQTFAERLLLGSLSEAHQSKNSVLWNSVSVTMEGHGGLSSTMVQVRADGPVACSSPTTSPEEASRRPFSTR